MNTSGSKQIPHWVSIPLSIVVLAVCVLYTYGAVYLTPYPGFEWGVGNLIAYVFSCSTGQTLCEANRGVLQPGDQILAVDDKDFDPISDSVREIPFSEYMPGDSVSIMFLRDGERRTVDWVIVGPSTARRAERLFSLLPNLIPFWLNGTLILFVLGPRSHSRSTRLLMASFNYATAIWLVTGGYARMPVMCNRLVEHALSWLLVPLYFHFHLVAPNSSLDRKWQHVLTFLYVFSAVFAILELFQALPDMAFGLALLLAFTLSLGALIFRLVFDLRPQDRRAVILMLVGAVVSFSPGLFLYIVPALLQIPQPGGVASTISSLSIPLLPFFYVYAIFKRHLGTFEARFRRGLALYSFLLLYVTVVAAVSYLGIYLLGPWGEWDTFAVVALVLFGVGAVPLHNLFQKSFGRLAYGISYDRADMLHAFATQVQAVVGSEEWMRVLADELDSRLLVRQSALCFFAEEEPELVYAHGVDADETLRTCRCAPQLLADAGRYRPAGDDADDACAWVRLAMPLRVRGKAVGVWLFGRRDPDSYYSEEDIELLTTLASQAAVVVENERLYEKALREIDERTQAEKALRESEEKVQAVLNATTESVILLDDQGVILSLNQTAARRFGRQVQEIAGQHISVLLSLGIFSPELLDARMTAIDKVFRSSSPVRFEDERDDAIYESSVYPILDADGRVRRVAIFARDITARRQAEQQELQVERLAAMSQVAGVLAHEINNPLQAIRSTLEMLVDFDLGSDEGREHLSVAIEEIQYLARVTHGVLEFTRSGNEHPRRVSAAEMLQNALTLVGEWIKSANIEVVISLPDQPVFVLAVPNQIVQVLFSLLVDAIETMPPSGGHLDVAVHANGDMASLSLVSSGTILVSDQIEHLFDPFFADEVGNAGLGLWISRGIVERHRGTVSVQNLEDDRGVVFEVTLPLYSPRNA